MSDYKHIVLQIAKMYRENNQSWCRRKYALDRYGENCYPDRIEDGVQFCPLGAFDRLVGIKNGILSPEALTLRMELFHSFKRTYGISITSWNDVPGRTVGEVIARLEEFCER